ncbi:hypothetical protein UB51_11425 [Paenibacillus sp. IHBB 10380]|nr:hypothetical protein UB51_11425 [Paenibacillus sp. IHBB 10380]
MTLQEKMKNNRVFAIKSAIKSILGLIVLMIFFCMLVISCSQLKLQIIFGTCIMVGLLSFIYSILVFGEVESDDTSNRLSGEATHT